MTLQDIIKIAEGIATSWREESDPEIARLQSDIAISMFEKVQDHTPLENIFDGTDDEFENIIRPWPVRMGKALAAFYLDHWKTLWTWAIMILLGLLGLGYIVETGS